MGGREGSWGRGLYLMDTARAGQMEEGHHDHMVPASRWSRVGHESSMLESPIGSVISRTCLTPQELASGLGKTFIPRYRGSAVEIPPLS
jgi:hypothetical protein